MVYTASMGTYHKGIQPLMSLGVDAVAYADNPQVCADGWDVRLMRRCQEHPRKAAKWPKLHPHILFPFHDLSIWIDAGWRVVNEKFVAEVVAALGDRPMAFLKHRWRTRLHDEAVATMEHAKYAGLPIRAQIEAYFADGYPDHLGLAECTMLVRRHHTKEAIAFDEAWWAENEQWTICDQLSAPYVMWKQGRAFDWLDYTLDTQPWLRLGEWRGDI